MKKLLNGLLVAFIALFPCWNELAGKEQHSSPPFEGAADLTAMVIRDISDEGLAKSLDASEEDLLIPRSNDLRAQRLAYTHKVLEVYGAGHYLLLEDGSVWQTMVWFDDPSVQLARSWLPGDIIEFHTEGGYFVINGKTPFEIKNQNNGSKISAWMELAPPLDSAHYIADMDPKGRHITLEDGSRWQMSWWQSWSSCKWVVGDRVFVSHDFKNNHYLLYNVDIGGWQHTWVKAALQLTK